MEANLPGAFFTKDPIEIIKNNDYTAVPWMTGWVPEEGVVRGGAIWVNQTLVDDLNNRFDELLPQILELEPMSATRTEEVLNLIKDFYFNGRREINQQGLIDVSECSLYCMDKCFNGFLITYSCTVTDRFFIQCMSHYSTI